jgi:hypothetical protein
MSNWTITYKGVEYNFPNFTDTLENTLEIEQRSGGVQQAKLEKSCQQIGDRKKDFTDDEKTKFTNLLLNERGIFGGLGTSEWDEFKTSIANITDAFDQSILSADFTDIESNIDEIQGWLAIIRAKLIANFQKVIIFKNNDQLGCGKGRCREKACHNNDFWNPTEDYYEDMVAQVNDQIEFLDNVRNTIGAIEDGTLDVQVLNNYVRQNREKREQEEQQAVTQDRLRKVMIAGAIVGALFLLIFIIRKIRNR